MRERLHHKISDILFEPLPSGYGDLHGLPAFLDRLYYWQNEKIHDAREREERNGSYSNQRRWFFTTQQALTTTLGVLGAYIGGAALTLGAIALAAGAFPLTTILAPIAVGVLYQAGKPLWCGLRGRTFNAEREGSLCARAWTGVLDGPVSALTALYGLSATACAAAAVAVAMPVSAVASAGFNLLNTAYVFMSRLAQPILTCKPVKQATRATLLAAERVLESSPRCTFAKPNLNPDEALSRWGRAVAQRFNRTAQTAQPNPPKPPADSGPHGPQ